ncbi:MAG: cobalamin-dependent protein, partial [Candidatus Lindowbacteria bacterium]|nr:cobalamin-dependent protein [Candidatus Lindowbacteria bacterium]
MSTTDTKKRRVIVGNRNVSETMTGCEVTSTKHTNYVSPLKRKIKRVFLIQPPAMTNLLRTDMNPNVPLGICYIGAMLERDGYEVAICDAFIEGWETEVPVSEDRMRVGLTYEEIEQKIRDFDPQVVGITSMFTMQRTIAHKMAEIARKIDPKIITIMGGAHPTSAPEMVMEDPDVDFIVLAEGDNAITPLLKTIENGGNLVDLDGICFRDDDAEMIYLKKTTLVNDLDSLPFPARHLVPMEKYFAAGVRHGG